MHVHRIINPERGSDGPDAVPRFADVGDLAAAIATRMGASIATVQLLTKSQAARMLGIGRTRTLQRLIDEGHLKTVAVGRRVRIPLSEVQRFAEEGEGASAPTTLPRSTPTRPRAPTAGRPGTLADELAKLRAIKI